MNIQAASNTAKHLAIPFDHLYQVISAYETATEPIGEQFLIDAMSEYRYDLYEHMRYNKNYITSWAQQLLLHNKDLLLSDVINLLGYWGTEEGEKIWQRVKAVIPAFYRDRETTTV